MSTVSIVGSGATSPTGAGAVVCAGVGAAVGAGAGSGGSTGAEPASDAIHSMPRASATMRVRGRGHACPRAALSHGTADRRRGPDEQAERTRNDPSAVDDGAI